MKISVITVCWNAEATIEKCIRSVLGQSYSDIEYVVVDGASSDGTLQILEKFRNRIDKLVSEPDSGIYEAMNKGIDLASGEYLLFLNADDVFLHERVIELAVSKMAGDTYEIYYGDVVFLDKESGALEYRKQDDIDSFRIFRNFPCQPATFYKKAVFSHCGKFSTNYKIVSDYLWIVSAYLVHGVQAAYLAMPISIFHIGGVCTNDKYSEIHSAEKKAVLDRFLDAGDQRIYKRLARKSPKALAMNPLNRFRKRKIKLKQGRFQQ